MGSSFDMLRYAKGGDLTR